MPPVIIYSVNTYLAWFVNEQYYDHVHYVWCSEAFEPQATGFLSPYSSTPASSSPRDIYFELDRAAKAPDAGNPKMAENKRGIINGATLKLADGTISTPEFDEITAIVAEADIQLFRPLVYVIPYTRVRSRLQRVPPARRAHVLSQEFIIERLNSRDFDVIVPVSWQTR